MEKQCGVQWVRWVTLSLCLVFSIMQAQAAHVYVKAGGSQTADYDSWAEAFGTLQAALDHVMANEPLGANIYLAGGTYEGAAIGASPPENSVFLLQSVSNVVIRGGYQGTSGSGAAPGTHDPAAHPTILRRTTGNTRVLALAGVSNAVIEHLTIRDGLNPSGGQGAGVHMVDSSDVTFQSVHFLANRTLERGGGVYLSGNTNVVISACVIDGNDIDGEHARGAGLYTEHSSVIVTNTLISNNKTLGGTSLRHGYGGGVYVDSGALRVTHSIVRDNVARPRSTNREGHGGGCYVAAGGTLELIESVVSGNRSREISSGSGHLRGGGIANVGTLYMRNVLVVSNRTDSATSDGIWLNGGSAIIENCTIADNNAAELTRIGIRYDSGSVAITNSIIWGHAADLLNFPTDGQGNLPAVWYSVIEDGQNLGFQNCHSLDPLFVDRTYYHLQSTISNYTGAYFEGGLFGSGSWATSAADSPFISRGNPASDNSRELPPNGGRINIGAYGNTGVASMKAPVTAAPDIGNPGAQQWGRTAILLVGEVLDDGGEVPSVMFQYWEEGSPGTNTVTLGIQAGVFSLEVSGLTPGTLYHYRAGGENALGTTWSSEASFKTQPVPAILYVGPAGDNTAGTNWATAFNVLQPALNLAENGDTLYIAGGTYADAPAFGDNTVFRWQNATNVNIYGGYEGNPALPVGDHPGPYDPDTWETVLARTEGNARILALSGLSNAGIRRVTVRDGQNPSGGQGGGIRLENSDAVSFIQVNLIGNETGDRGAGLYVAGSTDILFDSGNIVSNIILTPARGAGIYTETSTITVTNSLIAENKGGQHSGDSTSCRGGGVIVESGTMVVSHSVIRDNVARLRSNSQVAAGGGFKVEPGGTLHIRQSVITGNIAKHRVNSGVTAGSVRGGAIANRGILTMHNVLVASNLSNPEGVLLKAYCDGLWINGVSTEIVNCTIVDNHTADPENIGIRYAGGTFAMTNSIVEGHTFDLHEFGAAQFDGVWFSNIGDGQNNGAQGCVSLDSLFADRQYYHLQSTVSNYANAYFDSPIFGNGTWVTSSNNSPLIARGDESSDNSREPEPHGGRVNMGAYGNTEVAAMWEDIDVEPPTVVNPGALQWGYATALLRGEITDTGGEVPEAFFRYWPSTGSATTTVSVSLQLGFFTLQATGLTAGTEYNYQAGGTNFGGLAWSNVETFETHALETPLYVSANGDDTAGASWATAYTNFQTALDLAEPGTVVYLAGETYAGEPAPGENTVFEWLNATNVILRGGYEGDTGLSVGAHPGPRDSAQWETVLSRTTGAARILTIDSVSNAVIETVTIRGGLNPSGGQGGGVRLSNSHDVRFANVALIHNEVNPHGGGIYLVDNGKVVFDACNIVSNIMDASSSFTTVRGGGIFSSSSTVAVTNTLMANNGGHRGSQGNAGSTGGGVHLASGSMQVVGSVVRDNTVRYRSTGYLAYGGAFNVESGATLEIRGSVITGNRVLQASSSLGVIRGGAIANQGTLDLKNVLVAGNSTVTAHSDGIWTDGAGAVAHLNNVTIADNNTSVSTNIGVRYGGGTLSISNSIAWGHNTDLMNVPETGGILQNVGYTLFGGMPAMHGTNGCLVDVDPLFVDTVYYHLQSTEGVFEGGFFGGGTWEQSAATSPAVDAGDPDADWSGEPVPHGRRINMGAYGGTSVASMTPTIRGSVFMIR